MVQAGAQVGSTRARDLTIPGRELQGIHLAMEFLGAQQRALFNQAGRGMCV